MLDIACFLSMMKLTGPLTYMWTHVLEESKGDSGRDNQRRGEEIGVQRRGTNAKRECVGRRDEGTWEHKWQFICQLVSHRGHQGP